MDLLAVLKSIGTKRFGWRTGALHSLALPMAALTYAQGGEDMALYKRLKHLVPKEMNGFYVDIGCGAPHQLSNTYLFYCFGWRGICVDANPDHTASWAEYRPEDIFVCSAVGEVTGTTTLFRSEEKNWGFARIGAPPQGRSKPGIEVPMRRLDHILAEHAGNKPIAFMTIDVEGSELGVLASNDWSRWKPYVILVECNDFKFEAWTESPSVRLLQKEGYGLQDKIGENLLFVLK